MKIILTIFLEAESMTQSISADKNFISNLNQFDQSNIILHSCVHALLIDVLPVEVLSIICAQHHCDNIGVKPIQVLPR
jgi:hypothetical protein